MILWLKADAGAKINADGDTAGTDGDDIHTWKDQSGKENDVTVDDNVKSSQPKWYSNVVNGRPVIRFTGNATSGSPLKMTALPV